MNLKVLIVFVLPNVIGLPLEFCCNNEGHSNSLNIQMSPLIYPAVLESDSSETSLNVDPASSNHYQEASNQVIYNTVTPSSNDKDNQHHVDFKTAVGARIHPSFYGGSDHHRSKRFPIHLDPLYQYRYLARSGQCPTAKDGQPEFYCPTPDKMGNWRCIDDFQLCDGVRHCPNGEDELPVSCLFYRVVMKPPFVLIFNFNGGSSTPTSLLDGVKGIKDLFVVFSPPDSGDSPAQRQPEVEQ